MNKPKIVLASILAGIAAGVVSLGVPYGTPEKPWTPDSLQEAMKEAGMCYEARQIDGSLRLRRVGCNLSWEEIEQLTVPHLVKRPGCLHVVRRATEDLSPVWENSIRVNGLIVWGHPEELSRVRKALDR